jgi:hypothetical protein
VFVSACCFPLGFGIYEIELMEELLFWMFMEIFSFLQANLFLLVTVAAI